MGKLKYVSVRKVLSNNVIGDSQVWQKSFKKWDLQLESGKYSVDHLLEVTIHEA